VYQISIKIIQQEQRDLSSNSEGNRPPKAESGHFTTMRVLCYGFLFSLFMLGISSIFKPEHMQYWGYLVAVLAGYLAGNAKSTVDPPK